MNKNLIFSILIAGLFLIFPSVFTGILPSDAVWVKSSEKIPPQKMAFKESDRRKTAQERTVSVENAREKSMLEKSASEITASERMLTFSKKVFFENVEHEKQVEPGKQVKQRLLLPKSTSVFHPRMLLEEHGYQLHRKRPLSKKEQEELFYYIYLPETYAEQSAKEFPLLLFLHGSDCSSGCSGQKTEENLLSSETPPGLLEQKQISQWKFITVSPLCKDGMYWSPEQLLLLLDHLEKEYRIDRRRLYLTGYSMGGAGVWQLLNQAPRRFAAAAPICSCFNPMVVKKFAETPVWMFHGSQDEIIPISASQEMCRSMRESGGNIRLTVVPQGKHECWGAVYRDEKLYRWFLKYERSDAEFSADVSRNMKSLQLPQNLNQNVKQNVKQNLKMVSDKVLSEKTVSR